MNDGFTKFTSRHGWEECYRLNQTDFIVVVNHSGMIYITKKNAYNRVDEENFDTVEEAKFRLMMKYL